MVYTPFPFPLSSPLYAPLTTLFIHSPQNPHVLSLLSLLVSETLRSGPSLENCSTVRTIIQHIHPRVCEDNCCVVAFPSLTACLQERSLTALRVEWTLVDRAQKWCLRRKLYADTYPPSLLALAFNCDGTSSTLGFGGVQSTALRRFGTSSHVFGPTNLAFPILLETVYLGVFRFCSPRVGNAESYAHVGQPAARHTDIG